MHRHHRIRRTGLALAAPLASLALVVTPALAGAGVTEAKAASCSNWVTTPPPNPGTQDNFFRGVAALSPCDVWAVGDYRNGGSLRLTMAEHWNGTSWKLVHTPSPGNGSNTLNAVTAVAHGNVWAVGQADGNSLILHWNGRKWARVSSPSPGAFSGLVGVAAVSATGVWAVGGTGPTDAVEQTLILHSNGRKWARFTSPSPGHDGELDSVTAVSPRSAWAVGDYTSGATGKTLVEHWNGKKWVRAASPNPPGSVTVMALNGVSASSSSNAWAVGNYSDGSGQKTITLRWNGRAWKLVKSPSPASAPTLAGVTAISAGDAWAVGNHVAGSATTTLIMHWNGRAWVKSPSPSPGLSSVLTGATSTSADNVWAVGSFDNGPGGGQNLAIHCC